MPTKIRIEFTGEFKRQIKRLKKRYRHIQTDVEELIQELGTGATPGDAIEQVGKSVYKVRVKNSDTPVVATV